MKTSDINATNFYDAFRNKGYLCGKRAGPVQPAYLKQLKNCILQDVIKYSILKMGNPIYK
ncbi:MAG: hypothetical protein CVV13_07170 [Gammaproteobacteria bacterium HGW-Gammaproteobacteria-3]|nr:MAG: hypothetical protein CVV13_07170 [Gammaproteobacteria bacterium HGW-Gammaproteobacteria-3]